MKYINFLYVNPHVIGIDNANKVELEQQLADAIKASEAAGFDADQSPKVKELRERIAGIKEGASKQENAIFSHFVPIACLKFSTISSIKRSSFNKTA